MNQRRVKSRKILQKWCSLTSRSSQQTSWPCTEHTGLDYSTQRESMPSANIGLLLYLVSKWIQILEKHFIVTIVNEIPCFYVFYFLYCEVWHLFLLCWNQLYLFFFITVTVWGYKNSLFCLCKTKSCAWMINITGSEMKSPWRKDRAQYCCWPPGRIWSFFMIHPIVQIWSFL